MFKESNDKDGLFKILEQNVYLPFQLKQIEFCKRLQVRYVKRVKA